MALIAALFISAFFILCSHSTLAAPDPAIVKRGDLRPRFTPAAGISGFVTGTIGSYPTDTGSGCVGPTGTGYIGIPSAIPPYPYVTPIIKRPIVDTPSGGFIYPGTNNTTRLIPTGTSTCTGTDAGTGVVGPTGTGATGAVSATGVVIYPINISEKERRSQKAARNWWA